MTNKLSIETMKDVILYKWKGKIGHLFSYEDLNELERIIDYYEEPKNNYKQRIDEAIEYIEKNSHKTEWGELEQDNESIDINDDITDTEFIENLLNILGGEDNE